MPPKASKPALPAHSLAAPPVLAATEGSVEELEEPLEAVPVLEPLLPLPLPLDPESVPEEAAAEEAEEEEAAMVDDGGWELPEM